MPWYRIPVQQRWLVTEEWLVIVEATSQAEALMQLEAQLSATARMEALQGVVSVVALADDWDPESDGYEVQEDDITEEPCPPDPTQTTLL